MQHQAVAQVLLPVAYGISIVAKHVSKADIAQQHNKFIWMIRGRNIGQESLR